MGSDEIVRKGCQVAEWFGPRLKELRARAGVSQAALAKLIGVSQPRIAEYESPKARCPNWEIVARICFALDVDPTTFMRAPEKIQNVD